MASESKSGALKISSRKELENWLESLPLEERRWVAVAIAARAALRVVPLLAADRPRNEDNEYQRDFRNSIFTVFFAAALARAAAQFPNRASQLPAREAARAVGGAYFASTRPAADVAREAAFAVAAGDATLVAATSAVGTAAFAASFAASATVDEIWLAISRDISSIISGRTARALASEPLWLNDAPDWADEHWKLLQSGLAGRVNLWHPPLSEEQRRTLRDVLLREGNWQVWIDWYNRRLEGVSDPEEVELVFVTVPDKERNAGPAAANKWIVDRLEELSRNKPIIPPKLPATIEPIIADGKIALPANPSEADLDSETLGAALTALRAQIADFAGDLGVEANIDKRVIGFLRRLAENIPQAPPTQAQLFMLAHEQETLEAYGKTVATEWPELLARRYLAMTLAFDRTARQFPKWRLFKQNAAKNRLSDRQRDEAPKLAADFAAALREEEAAEWVAAEIPDTFEEMCRQLDAARNEARDDRIAAGVDTVAEDAVTSIENIIKLIAETALAGGERTSKAVMNAGAAYADGLEEGMKDQAKKEGKKDGAALVKWSKRTIMGVAGVAATGISAKTAGLGPVIVRVIEGYPQIAEWLRPVVHFFSQ